MIVKVILFASAKDVVGSDAVELNLDQDATVADVKSQLVEQHPDLLDIIERSTWSVDHEYVDLSAGLHESAEIGLLPPVSGG